MMDDTHHLQLEKEHWRPVITENFDSYEEGDFSEPYSAVGEVHYLSKKIDQGIWEEISTHHMYPHYGVKWEIQKRGDTKVLKQVGHNLYHRRNWKYPIKKYLLRRKDIPNLFFPAFVTGECNWQDYMVRVKLKIFSKDDIAGVLFRMVDGRHHYMFCLKKNYALLLKREQNDLQVIAKKKYAYNSSFECELKVTAIGEQIVCDINDKTIIQTSCNFHKMGKVGVIANVPTEFSLFDVVIPRNIDSGQVDTERGSPSCESKCVSQGSVTPMKLLKKIPLNNQCSGRSIRFGDLTGNGVMDMLLIQGEPLFPGNNYNMINSLTAIDLDGNILWKNGKSHEQKSCLCSDLAIQIYDIDNDGYNEIICSKDFFLQILDGRTGEEKNKIPTPPAIHPTDKLPNIIGDAIYICNLSGSSRPQDILIKDRYSKIWAYDNNLNLLWDYHYQGGEIGHFPFAIDINEDGKDEILLGNVLLNHEGKELWDLKLGDHADASAIFKAKNTNQYIVAIAASDEGFILADIKGNIKKHLRLGHMQTVTVAKLRVDLPGYQFATNTYWGNPGIIYILDESGNILSSFQPSMYGSPICPVKWLDNDQELLLLSAAPDKTGGLYDSFGDQIVAFPDDGHPTLCYDALDLNNDGWDELICWDHDSLWIYSKNYFDGRATGPNAMIDRYPEIYNGSNYRSNVSLAF